MAEKETDSGLSLAESEQRLKQAFERLKNAVAKAQADSEKVQLLEVERNKLVENLESLKSDYEGLETAFQDLRGKYEAAQAATSTQAAPSEDVIALTRARDTAVRELAMVKSEYEALDRSFGLLKSRYVALQETNEEDGFVTPAASDNSEIRAERDRLQNDLDRLKQDYQAQSEALTHIRSENDLLKKVRGEVTAKLDDTISKLEQLTIH